MQTPVDIYTYNGLCGAQHKAIYVAMAVMLSCFTGASFEVIRWEWIAT